MLMDITASVFITILTVIGLLALIVTVITDVTKGVVILEKIPRNVQVIVLSLTLTLVAYFAYISYHEEEIIWYYVVADIIAGFVVAYVVLYGWDKFAGLYKRFRNIPTIGIAPDPAPGLKSAITEDTTASLADKKIAALTDEDPPESFASGAAVTSTAGSSKTDITVTELPVSGPSSVNMTNSENIK